MGSRRAIWWFFLPGIVLHELAHAAVVVALPNARVTTIDLTSHVEWEGRGTITTQFLVSYAPVYLNTAVAVACAYAITQIAMFERIELFALSVGLMYLAFVSAAMAYPSRSDAVGPVKALYARLFGGWMGVFYVLVAPLVIALSLPGIVLAYVGHASGAIRMLVGVLYATVIVSLGAGVLTVADVTSLFEQL